MFGFFGVYYLIKPVSWQLCSYEKVSNFSFDSQCTSVFICTCQTLVSVVCVCVTFVGINTLMYIMSKMANSQETTSEIHHYERLEFLGDAVIEFLSRCLFCDLLGRVCHAKHCVSVHLLYCPGVVSILCFQNNIPVTALRVQIFHRMCSKWVCWCAIIL